MTELICEDHLVEGSGDGLRLFVRNKRTAGERNQGPQKTVLFVHGATYPSTVTFDYAIDGSSWMDVMAAAGFDAWLVDLAGYGNSERPAEMSQPAADNPPLVDTSRAVADVACVVDFILGHCGLERLNLIGYSWGTTICGDFAGRCPDQVARLVLYGAGWLRDEPPAINVSGEIGAYRYVEATQARDRWLIGRNDEEAAMIVPPGRIDEWTAAAVASDPEAGLSDPPRLRAPCGVVKDVREYMMQGRPRYDPGRIEAATLVVVGEWDMETTPSQCRAVFERLSAAADRRLVVIGRGTHSLLLENQRHVLHRTVDGFLKET
jgi:pimeloyl-ACP methyl ester carboxylesterase